MSNEANRPLEEQQMTTVATPPPVVSILWITSDLEKIHHALELIAQDRDSIHAKLDKLLMGMSDIEDSVEDIGKDLEEMASDLQDVVFDEAYPGVGEED